MPASASTKTVHDAQGDSKAGHADIRTVVTKSTARRVIWTVTSYTAFTTKRAPCVGIYLGASQHPPGDNYEICGNGKVQDFAHGGTAGEVVVRRPDSKTVVYRVLRKALGRPSVISWAVQVRESAGCFPDLCDQAAEGPGQHVVQHV
jgi:hypothetical protein